MTWYAYCFVGGNLIEWARRAVLEGGPTDKRTVGTMRTARHVLLLAPTRRACQGYFVKVGSAKSFRFWKIEKLFWNSLCGSRIENVAKEPSTSVTSFACSGGQQGRRMTVDRCPARARGHINDPARRIRRKRQSLSSRTKPARCSQGLATTTTKQRPPCHLCVCV